MSEYREQSELLQAALSDLSDTLKRLVANEKEMRQMVARMKRKRLNPQLVAEIEQALLRNADERATIEQMRAETLHTLQNRPHSDELH